MKGGEKMPRFDGTGPLGNSAFGRGLGPCGSGIAWCKGRNFGRGFGWMRFASQNPYPVISQKDEMDILTKEAKALEERLSVIKNQLDGLKDQE